MNSYLTNLLECKRKEVDKLPEYRGLEEALRSGSFHLIAEIKRRSPALGRLSQIEDPVCLAERYLKGGATALSILTDQEGFGGSIEDLRSVAKAFPAVPILRKDFIIDSKQIIESARAGATAILLIVAVLKRHTKELLETAASYGLEALVEVHNLEELHIAIQAGASMIGVNNRNLDTFAIDLAVAEHLAKQIPKQICAIAESGVLTVQDAARMQRAGYQGVLVGQALVKADDPAEMIRKFLGFSHVDSD